MFNTKLFDNEYLASLRKLNVRGTGWDAEDRERAIPEQLLANKSGRSAKIVSDMILQYSLILTYLDSPSRILDVCAGSGYGASLLADSEHTVTALDYDVRWVDKFRPNVNSLKADLRKDRPELNGKFNGITMIEAIEHFEHAEQLRIMKRVFSWLTADGLLVIGTPRPNVSQKLNRFHLWELSWDDFNSLVDRAGPWSKIDRYLTYWNGHFTELRRVYDSSRFRGECQQVAVARK